MHPTLFEIGGFPVGAYGVALCVSFAVGIWIARKRAIAHGLDGDRVLDAGILILVTSLVGARFFFVVTNPEQFRPPAGGWSDVFDPFSRSGLLGMAGFSMMGGVVLSTASALAYFAWRKLPVLEYADVLAPSVCLGEGITRLGCFLNGCCFGLPCDLPWAVRFPPGSQPAAALGAVSIHPAQLYASLAGFLGFVILSALLRRKDFHGAVFFGLLVFAPGYRIALDFIRYQNPGEILIQSNALGGLFQVTASQAISAAAVVLAIAGWRWARRKARIR